MKPDKLYQSQKKHWQELETLLKRSRNGIQNLLPREIDAMGQLYRSATSDLALAQRDFPTHKVTDYLNQLVARAHAVVYRGEPLAYKRLLRFVTHGLPRIYREALPFVLVATLLFLIPALFAGVSTAYNPQAAKWMLPTEYQTLVDDIERQELWTDIPISERPYTSTFIMSNNIQVSFYAFGGGILWGLISIWVMIFNGLMLGGITGLTIHYNIGFELWTFVIGHGVIELSVITIAGGTGLMLGWSLIHPGMLHRRDSLVLAARKAVRLLIGCVPLLLLAGTIEGFISPAENIPWIAKWSLGIGSGILLYSYLLLGGREKSTQYKVAPTRQ